MTYRTYVLAKENRPKLVMSLRIGGAHYKSASWNLGKQEIGMCDIKHGNTMCWTMSCTGGRLMGCC
jgi:hypothetical protein